MRTVYADTAEPAPETPPLAGEARCEALVIGGGFTGLSTALHLAERGVGAVLLEAQGVGFGASGRNGGQVNPGLKADPDQVERAFGADLGGRMVAFSGAAPAFLFELIGRLSIPCALRRCGTLRAAIHPKQAAAALHTARQLELRGAPVEFLGRDAMSAATGTTRYHGGMLDHRGGDLNPLSLARGLARAALAAGARVHAESRVQSLQSAGGRWIARTASGAVSASHVVLATNGYTDNLWPNLRRSIVPVYSSIAASAPLPESLAREVLPAGHVVYESGTVTVYYRLDPERRLLIGGRGPQREIRSPGDVGYLLKYAERLWPAIDGIQWTHAWGGRIAMTADHYPHLHEPATNLTVCLGYNGRGVALATAIGAQLARRVIDSSAAVDLPITPIKPIPFQGYWPLVVPAAVAVGRARDALGL